MAMHGSHAERSLPGFHLSFGSECRVLRTARHHVSLMSSAASLCLPSLSLSQQIVSTDCGGLFFISGLCSRNKTFLCECLELLLANFLSLLDDTVLIGKVPSWCY